MNPGNINGWTPLHDAASNGHFEICKLIMENIQDKNPCTTNNYLIMKFTPLELARAHGHHQIEDYIISQLVKIEKDSKALNEMQETNKELQTTEDS